MLDHNDDRALVVRAKQKDPEAFGQLYERYAQKIYGYVYYRTGNTQEAEDLTAKVFYRAMSRLGTYTDRGLPFSAWLYRIAHNLVANWYRDQGRRRVTPLDKANLRELAGDAPEAAAETQEQRRALLAAIGRLPEERQQLIILKFVDRLSNAEIGQVMNRSEGAIKSLYHRTLEALRDDLTAAPSRRAPSDSDR